MNASVFICPSRITISFNFLLYRDGGVLMPGNLPVCFWSLVEKYRGMQKVFPNRVKSLRIPLYENREAIFQGPFGLRLGLSPVSPIGLW